MIFGIDLTISSLQTFIVNNGYAFLFGWVFLEQLGLPIGAAPMLLAAGALAGFGKMNFAFIFLVVWGASLISDLFWYYLGKKRGGQVLSFLCRVSLNPDFCVGRTKNLFAKHGAPSLLVAKFLPGINTI
ncbi:MAG: sulfurtransferase, partial [Deltaproteobacteria bacterium]|nr:sulfurtransferase [Deltaproteobacteria bacterium]